MRKSHLFLSIIASMLLVATAAGQFKEGGPLPGGIEFGEAKPQQWKIGVSITAVGGACAGITGYVPVPMEWPEQDVRVVEEDISASVKSSNKVVEGSAKMMVLRITRLPSGQTVNALVTYEVTHRPQLPPDATDGFVLADTKKLPRDVRRFLTASPKIESKDPQIRKQADEIFSGAPGDAEEEGDAAEADAADKKTAKSPSVGDSTRSTASSRQSTAWEQVETIYDWVREHVTYKRGPQKGALDTLKSKVADCEGMTALFIALCRAKDIPARTVWVQGHCYPEFYLADREGKGYWFPCQVAGDRSFGGIPETRPILQKGDNFRSLDNSRERVHYLHTVVTGNRMAGKPRIREFFQAVSK